MWLKVVIVILFIGLAVSLFTGLGFLLKNQGRDQQSRAVWYSLTVRLVLAGLLMGCIIYGIRTGILGSKAPWDARYAEDMKPSDSTQSTHQSMQPDSTNAEDR